MKADIVGSVVASATAVRPVGGGDRDVSVGGRASPVDVDIPFVEVGVEVDEARDWRRNVRSSRSISRLRELAHFFVPKTVIRVRPIKICFPKCGKIDFSYIPTFPFAAGQWSKQAPVPPSLSGSMSIAEQIISVWEHAYSWLRRSISVFMVSMSPSRAE